MGTGGSHARQSWPVGVLLICVAAGLMFTVAAATADGSDLRPTGGDVASLVQERSATVEQRQAEARRLQAEIDGISDDVDDDGSIDDVLDRLTGLRDLTGLAAARGPGVRVTLTDAPRSVEVPGLDPNALVVHQQDLQAFVNALWAGGAEAVSLQGQRIVSTTGIKCVGSTVVLDGVPYAPPYVIEAVGDVGGMNFSLATSPEVATYGRYAEKSQLGLDVEPDEDIDVAAYAGTVALQHATALR